MHRGQPCGHMHILCVLNVSVPVLVQCVLQSGRAGRALNTQAFWTGDSHTNGVGRTSRGHLGMAQRLGNRSCMHAWDT